MERKIGETFEFEGKKLQVKESTSSGCGGCFFDEQRILCSKNVAGYCDFRFRADKKKVIFVEVKEETKEQHQEEQPQKLNLCEILKDCPERWKFWSPLLGNVKLHYVCKDGIRVRTAEHTSWKLNQDGTVTIGASTSPEIMLYPSREQRDWSKFTAPWYKKEKFDPKTLKPFDSVLVYGEYEGWFCTIFSHIGVGEYPYNTASGNYGWCIPYNDETKHLVGTTDKAPEFYKYWEDC